MVYWNDTWNFSKRKKENICFYRRKHTCGIELFYYVYISSSNEKSILRPETVARLPWTMAKNFLLYCTFFMTWIHFSYISMESISIIFWCFKAAMWWISNTLMFKPFSCRNLASKEELLRQDSSKSLAYSRASCWVLDGKKKTLAGCWRWAIYIYPRPLRAS